jgi:toxin YhaV
MLTKYGWKIYLHDALLDQIEDLKSRITKKADDAKAKKHLAWLVNSMFDKIPANPAAPEYRQGKTLGEANTHWFVDRYKGRYRLFFRYDSGAKAIAFAWTNDEETLRTRGAKTDAYAVFAKKLASGCPPNDWPTLMKEASSEITIKRAKTVFFKNEN